MTWVIILLLVIGVLLLMLEIFVIPGTSVAGIAGGALIFYSIWQSYSTFGSKIGTIMLIGSVFLIGFAVYLTFKLGTWERVSLKTAIDGKVNTIDENLIKIDDQGTTVSRLAPSGKALINEQIAEVHTFGEFIDENVEIKVISLKDNKIYVTLK